VYVTEAPSVATLPFAPCVTALTDSGPPPPVSLPSTCNATAHPWSVLALSSPATTGGTTTVTV
jgi:hypothetical protein